MSNINKEGTYLSFYLGKELFAANVEQILEVLRDEQLTEIPRSKDFIEGIINFRGEIVTVIDLFKKLNMQSGSEKTKNIIVVFEISSNDTKVKVGVMVDKVQKVFTISEADCLPIPEFGKYYNPEYLTGVTKLDENFVKLLNINKVLNDDEVSLILENKEN